MAFAPKVRDRKKANSHKLSMALYTACAFLMGHYVSFVGHLLILHDVVLLHDDKSISGPSQLVDLKDTIPDVETNLVEQHSFGLLKDIPNHRWKEIVTSTKAKSWWKNPDNPLENHLKVYEWNTANLNPNFDCPNMVPMPLLETGESKYVCNPQRLVYDDKPCLIYSFGSNGNFRFEDAIFDMHGGQCEIHIFDPSSKYERPGDVPNKNIHYHPWGLKSTYDDSGSFVPWGTGGSFLSFPETLKRLGHQNRTIDILKMDCEGCEWATIQDWIGSHPRQVLVEIHGVPSPLGTPSQYWYRKPLNPIEGFYDLFREHGYVLFHKDPNDTCCLELAFMRMNEDFWKQ